MNTAEKVRLILLEEFVKAQARNPNYSMRSYAKKIGLAQSAVSEILAGIRNVLGRTRKYHQTVCLVYFTKDIGAKKRVLAALAASGVLPPVQVRFQKPFGKMELQ